MNDFDDRANYPVNYARERIVRSYAPNMRGDIERRVFAEDRDIVFNSQIPRRQAHGFEVYDNSDVME